MTTHKFASSLRLPAVETRWEEIPDWHGIALIVQINPRGSGLDKQSSQSLTRIKQFTRLIHRHDTRRPQIHRHNCGEVKRLSISTGDGNDCRTESLWMRA